MARSARACSPCRIPGTRPRSRLAMRILGLTAASSMPPAPASSPSKWMARHSPRGRSTTSTSSQACPSAPSRARRAAFRSASSWSPPRPSRTAWTRPICVRTASCRIPTACGRSASTSRPRWSWRLRSRAWLARALVWLGQRFERSCRRACGPRARFLKAFTRTSAVLAFLRLQWQQPVAIEIRGLGHALVVQWVSGHTSMGINLGF
mmetsp:Transcript_26410/g.75594  ORF Transcript_26410/g.75594 Transcript_26410/m.75594 type:complete len:207 (+) Transcript_26410:156-776(+)